MKENFLLEMLMIGNLLIKKSNKFRSWKQKVTLCSTGKYKDIEASVSICITFILGQISNHGKIACEKFILSA